MFAAHLYRFIGIALALGLVAHAASGAPGPTPLDRIVVVVNDGVITESELGTRLSQLKRQLAVEGIAPPADAVLRRQLLDRMVSEQLQLELAERAGIRVTDEELDEALQTVAKTNRMTVAEFRQNLIKSGIDPKAHAAELRTQIAIRELVGSEVGRRVSVSEAEIAALLETQKPDADAEYNLSHIFLPLPETASPETIQSLRARAEEVLKQLKAGAKFEETAVANSRGEAAFSGGNIGWKKSGQLPDLFATAVRSLAVGSTTEVLRGPNGFHILRLNERRGGGAVETAKQTHVRHILVRRNELVSAEEARAKLLNLRARIELGDDFAALAKAHSEDPGSAANGGDLGWMSPGNLVPEFETAMEALKPGELSQPVATQFGLHLIQVLDRRTQDITQERLRANARQQIHARKASEYYEQWLRRLRDDAYIEYVGEDAP